MALPQDTVSDAPSHVPSPEELPALYASGMSLNEIAAQVGRSQTYVRKRLLKQGISLRTRGQGSRAYRERHPEYMNRLYKWKVNDPGVVTQARLLMMTLIITEGCLSKHTVQFTNTQEQLHQRFRDAARDAYGEITLGRNGLNSRISSSLVLRDLEPHIRGKVFSEQCLRLITASNELCVKVCRIIADTEGSMIISVRRAPRNFTVEFRVVLASTNQAFSRQIQTMLASLGMQSNINRVGVHIMRKEHIKAFVQMVGFTPGLKVIRKKAGYGVWYGHDKSIMTKVFLWISDRQDDARGNPKKFVFADCKTREQTVERLMSIYRQVCGG